MESLAKTPQFVAAFHVATQQIRQSEVGGDAFEHSNPQIVVGASIGTKLAEVERQAETAIGWEPPIYKTEEGRVRRLLGDYLSATQGRAGDTQIRWLSLQKVGKPIGGVFPISAWTQFLYHKEGKLEMTFDPVSNTLRGNQAALPNAKLKVDGEKLSGTAEFGGISFKKVARREVFEARANHPRQNEKANAQSVIRLLYIGAKDCPPCVKWEHDHIDDGLLTKMPEYSDIVFVKSKRYSIRSKLQADDLPADVKFIYETLEKDNDMKKMLSYTPAFALLVDNKIRIWSTGLFLDSPIYSVLRAAVREKRAAVN